MTFDHSEFEPKWQKQWDDAKLFAAADASAKEKFYVLVEFPYPSGDGLHVGHCRSYTALDIVARQARMSGKNVLFPIGFDAFGLPTENFAIKNKIHPRTATDKNIANFTRQLKSIGFSFDWERVVDTTDPQYYKWTQWIFLKFLEAGLAYQAKIPINWCVDCKIGLANEEVVDGKCERCGGKIERRVKQQWMLAITKYAQQLLDGLETVDFLPRIKAQQQNWIGRSEGAEVDFAISGLTRGEANRDFHPSGANDCEGLFLLTWNTVAANGDEENDSEQKNFTPGEKLIDSSEKARAILDALAEAEDAAKDGFKILEAVVAENHVHAVVWISEESGGIGVVVKNLKGISSRRFWQQNPPPPPPPLNTAVSTPPNTTVNGGVKKDKNDKSQFNHLWRHGYHFSLLAKHASYENAMNYIASHKQKSKLARFFSELPLAIRVFTTRPDTLFGATYTVLSPEHALLAKLKPQIQNWAEVQKYISAAAAKSDLERTELAKEKTGVKLAGVAAINPVSGEEIPIFVADYVLASYGTGAIMAVPAHDERDFEFATKFEIEIREVVQSVEAVNPRVNSGVKPTEKCFAGDGVAINSGEFDGLPTAEFKKKIVAFLEEKGVGKRAINFKLRDWVFSRQRYWGEPIPVVHCEKCGIVPLNLKDLPLELPPVEKYEPTETGESPLAAITDWVQTTCPKCGGAARRETDTMPNWAGSSWYFLRYIDPRNDQAFADPAKLKYWLPVDLYNGGMEHTVLHLLYSRFWHKFLFDQKLVPTPEPYARRISHGMILGPDGEKMSKSRGNVINPDEIVRKFGADTLRLYEMFIGPFDQAASWSEGGVAGVRKFLEKVWRLFEKLTNSVNPELEKSLHKTIKKVSQDITGRHFNTAVSSLMIFVNEATQVGLPQNLGEDLLRMLAPFAPHLTEEIWAKLGHTTSIHLEKWPSFDPALAKDETITLAISVNGKLRDTISVAAEIGKDEALALAKQSEKIQKWLDGKEISKEIFVPGKMINFVIG
ncbi:MAG: leucine--tRNA ligase [Patescibacteria group bacterium]